ncbi:MAG: glutamyl-tRNA reductase [Lachnospiraceae bacterium]|nr:glutamyl-tRNA reductase [Lachnospiraceae bacterium]
MGISLLSISHRIAPLEIRQLFAFPQEVQVELMQRMIAEGTAQECVLLSTCNRTEIYTYMNGDRDGFTPLQELLFQFANAEHTENMGSYVRFYRDTKAIQHLFQVSAGLDSMVLGEDQILGQVKHAHELAREAGTCGVYLNTMFRYAVTASKKVKTETDLSRTSVSTATMAVKAAEQILGSLKGKNVMLIGASGKIGGIVLRNLQCIEGVKIYITSRNKGKIMDDCHHKAIHQVMEYENRYELADEMDVMISATSSPHYTLTYERLKKNLRMEKTRVLVDLAVPMDIEKKVSQIPGIRHYDMDDFAKLAKENNEKKQREILAADHILEQSQLAFERWMVYQQSLPQIAELKAWMLEEAERKGLEKAIDKLFYKLRDHSDPKELQRFFEYMKES